MSPERTLIDGGASAPPLSWPANSAASAIRGAAAPRSLSEDHGRKARIGWSGHDPSRWQRLRRDHLAEQDETGVVQRDVASGRSRQELILGREWICGQCAVGFDGDVDDIPVWVVPGYPRNGDPEDVVGAGLVDDDVDRVGGLARDRLVVDPHDVGTDPGDDVHNLAVIPGGDHGRLARADGVDTDDQ